ncbi:hypothetical protein HD554DRAFT_2041365 [Boletus coccyginus]|nr:hypothetical protein HD554DRAFT_2041365 [Boletus coccyginus]
MQFTYALVLLVRASYTLARTTCADCAPDIGTMPLSKACYRASAIPGGQPETVCTYGENDGVATAPKVCTYNVSGNLVQGSLAEGCAQSVKANSQSCSLCPV